MASDGSDGNVSNDRNKHLGFFGITTAILLCCLIVGYMAYVSGRETERRDQTPAAYSDTAKNKAQQDCVKLEDDAAFECIYEKVTASQEQARGEQDLDAQQRSANGTAITAFVALIGLAVSVVGIGLVYTTFKETRKANIIAREGMERQLRAYLTSSDFKTRGMIGPNNRFVEMVIQAIVHNSGQTPALLQFGIMDVRIVEARSEIPNHKVPIGITPPLNSTIGGGLYGTAGSQVFAREVIEKAFEGEIKIILYVGIGYQDVFGKCHETRYVVQARPLFHPTAFEQSGGNWKGSDLSPDALFEYIAIHERRSFT